MEKVKTSRTVSVTVSLPRGFWLREFNLHARHADLAIELLRGRLTGHEALVVIRVEGLRHQVEEALRSWKSCGFKVTEGDFGGVRLPPRFPRNRDEARIALRELPTSGDLLSGPSTPRG